MKRFEVVFSVVYLSVMLGCVFLAVESWPFSDWRVYAYANKFESVKYYVVEQSRDGVKSEPYTGSSIGMKISDMFEMHEKNKHDEKIFEECDRVYGSLLQAQKIDLMKIYRVSVSDKGVIRRALVCIRPEE